MKFESDSISASLPQSPWEPECTLVCLHRKTGERMQLAHLDSATAAEIRRLLVRNERFTVTVHPETNN